MTENRKNIWGVGVMTALSLGIIVCANPLYDGISSMVKASRNYTAGTYAGIAAGFGGDVVAVVTVDEKGITAVELTGDSETPEIGGAALETLAPAFVQSGDAMVDGISGSTITSNAAMKAVKHALEQAEGKAEVVDVDLLLTEKAADEKQSAAAEAEPVEIGDYFYDGGLRTGLATIHSMSGSKDAGEADGSAKVETTVAAVVIDGEGRVVSCKIDMVQSSMAFTAEGKVVMSDDFKTKKELGDAYGMIVASGIGKEWYQQAEAIEQYVVGKTAKEIVGIAVDESMKPTDVDLASGATMAIGGFQNVIIKAIQNAEEIGTQEGDNLGLAVVTNMSKSTDAAADKDGQCQAYSTYMAITTDTEGKITAGIIDASQGTVKFDATGKITSDVNVAVATKRELGDSYGMKNASGIGKEWYEQVDAFEEYIVGKTADEVAGLAVTEGGQAADVDLAAGVTIAIGEFQAVTEKAAADAEGR